MGLVQLTERLAVGTNGQVLSADSTQATGLVGLCSWWWKCDY
jgi:hypothetical protein